VDLTWLDREHLDDRDVAGALAVQDAARSADSPYLLGQTVSSYTGWLRDGWDGDPPTAAVERDRHGRVRAVLEVHFPRWDNTHIGSVEVVVDPFDRRRGIGRRLFEIGVERVRAAGRTVVLTESLDLPANIEFAKAMGLDRAMVEVFRRQDIRTLDRDLLAQKYAEAERHASGYELVRIPGATPEDMIADIAELTAAINDAPTGDLDVEDEVFSSERIRAFETAQLGRRRRLYRLVARERATGALAGHTLVAIEGERPWFGMQFDTSVLRSHRGHRLGLLLKTAMLDWLAETEPQLRTIDTGNAESNAHMIRVNEALGYRVLTTATEWQRRL
jgi:GNAT superfamily N-acetyltransferase